MISMKVMIDTSNVTNINQLLTSGDDAQSIYLSFYIGCK